MSKEKDEADMLQKNHHFLFPETFFGSFANFEDECFEDDVDTEIDVSNPWVLVLGSDKTDHFQQKIGLFIHWNELNS